MMSHAGQHTFIYIHKFTLDLSLVVSRISNWGKCEERKDEPVCMTLSVTLSKTPVFIIGNDILVPVSNGLTLTSFL